METSVDKCLAFCQSLAMSGQKFSFTLSIGKDTFSFNNKELGSSSCVKRKKKSPSQVRREQRRKEERSLKKAAEATEKVAEASEFQCSQCDSSFKTEEDLNAHIGEVHTAPVLPTPEKERAPNQVAELLLTPGGIGPISRQRKEDNTQLSVCDLPTKPGGSDKCGKSFTNENDLRMHLKKNHNYCFEHERAVEANRRCWMCM